MEKQRGNRNWRGKVMNASDVTAIAKHVLDLLSDPDLVHGVLVESFHETVDPVVRRGIGRHAVNLDGTYTQKLVSYVSIDTSVNQSSETISKS